MARRLFFAEFFGDGVPTPPDAPRRAAVRGAEARHLAQVLRAQPGMRFELAVAGERYLGAVATADPAQVTFDLLQRLEAAPAPAVSAPRLLVAVFKFDRFEWLLEKATELGVAAIQPLAAGRSDPRLARAAAARLERWRRILQNAAQQARRQDIPALSPPVTWAELPAAAAEASGCRLLLSEDPSDPPLATALPASPAEEITLAVGPEGGWTEADRVAAAALGFAPCSLGHRILRAETAAIAALAYLSLR